jgi:uncharacterized protein
MTMTRKQKILTITAVTAFLGAGLAIAHDVAISNARAAREAGKAAGLSCPLGLDKPDKVQAASQAAITPITLTPDDVQKLHIIAFDAAREGDIQTLAAYFSSGFDVNGKNARGDTLLILAAYHGQEKAVELILNQPKVDLDYKNNMGFTALTGAVYKGFNPIVQQLIDKGANVNTANGSGQTPLMFAALFGRQEAARLLIRAGANPAANDAQGNTAVSLAKAQGNASMLTLLETHEKPL